jgi:uncharacterized membrane protein
MKLVRFITQAAIIAALYAALTIVLAPISFGPVQFRVSEALTVLPAFTSAAIPGLTIGCLIANTYSIMIIGPTAILDLIFGTIATLLAALLSYKMPKRYLVPLPPIVVNGIIIGLVLHYVLKVPLVATMASVAFGEAIVCYALGYPLMLMLDKQKEKIFKHGKIY